MDRNYRPEPGQKYRHFKNKLYQIIGIARHSETEEEMVVYQALYGDFGLYVRPLQMFMEETDHEKYPDVTQKYRFELVTGEKEREDLKVRIEDDEEQNVQSGEKMQPDNKKEMKEQETINPYLLKFLDTGSYREKLQVLNEIKKYLDERLMDDICLSLDFVIEEGTLEERYEQIENCIETRARFETSRLR